MAEAPRIDVDVEDWDTLWARALPDGPLPALLPQGRAAHLRQSKHGLLFAVPAGHDPELVATEAVESTFGDILGGNVLVQRVVQPDGEFHPRAIEVALLTSRHRP